jgi:hypothetical protein
MINQSSHQNHPSIYSPLSVVAKPYQKILKTRFDPLENDFTPGKTATGAAALYSFEALPVSAVLLADV